MKNYFAAAAVMALFVTSAQAADLPARAYSKAPIADPVSNWSGFYLGISGGYSWNRLIVNDLDYFDGLGDNSLQTHGGIVGGTVGYNFQNRHLVYGVEADISYLSNKGTSNNDRCTQIGGCTNNGNGVAPVGTPFAQINSKIDALGTFRGRIGIEVEPALLYLTGGLAVGHVDNSYVAVANIVNGSCTGCTWNDKGWRPGWIAGAGVETTMGGNWSAKVEALYYQLEARTTEIVSTVNFNFNNGAPSRQRFDDAGFIARVGLNYKLGNGAVVARY